MVDRMAIGCGQIAGLGLHHILLKTQMQPVLKPNVGCSYDQGMLEQLAKCDVC